MSPPSLPQETSPASPAQNTIAQVLSGREDGSGRKRSRQAAITEMILEKVEAHPGVTAAEIAREIGEKDIFVLSLADELVRNGTLVCPQRDGKLFLPVPASIEVTNESSGTEIAFESVADEKCKDIEQDPNAGKIKLANMLLRLYRILSPMRAIEIKAGWPLEARIQDEIFLEARPVEKEISVMIKGSYPDSALVELTRFRNIKERPVKILPEEYVIEIRCETQEEIDALGPGLERCYTHRMASAGNPEGKR